MTDNGLRALEEELGGTVPDSLRLLDAAHVKDLTAAVRNAKRDQAAALEEAGEKALRHIPRLLRVPVRKALG